MTGQAPLIVVYIVTFRRHEMLKRALGCVLAQTHRRLRVKVVNDDPADPVVEEIVAAASDERAQMLRPVAKRGATRNFNLMFQDEEADFVSLLEDDNWWEPTFLEQALTALQSRPDHVIVVGNERLWRETPEGWLDTGQTIWPISDVHVHRYNLEEICGSAKLCNSAMLVRMPSGRALATPDTIPVDVTEHFRERLLGQDILLHGAPLVHYAQTLRTARAERGEVWGSYQQLLIGSVFMACTSPTGRETMARRLWDDCRSATSPRAVSLVAAGLALAEARTLARLAPPAALARFAVWAARRPARVTAMFNLRRSRARELAFLAEAPLTKEVASAFC